MRISNRSTRRSPATCEGRTVRFPLRDDRLLPLTEYVRRAIISGAMARDIAVIATNSDGDSDRRAFLLDQLGPGATERIADPGEEVVAPGWRTRKPAFCPTSAQRQLADGI